MYQSEVKALAWVPPLARCQSSLFSFQAFLCEQGVCVCVHQKAPRRNGGPGRCWGCPEQLCTARLVPSLLCHHQSLKAITTHQQFLQIRASQLGAESLWYFPALLSKYAITRILWTFMTPFHTRVWVLHKHSFPKPHTTHLRKRAQHPFLPLFSLRAGTVVARLPLQIPMVIISNVYPTPAPKFLHPAHSSSAHIKLKHL